MKKETQQNEANNKPKIIVICISLKAYVAKKKNLRFRASFTKLLELSHNFRTSRGNSYILRSLHSIIIGLKCLALTGAHWKADFLCLKSFCSGFTSNTRVITEYPLYYPVRYQLGRHKESSQPQHSFFFFGVSCHPLHRCITTFLC